jgi:pimeloyl-ACP methyl ester carboxylesterase
MNQTAYQTVSVDGLSIFYREAGPRDAPTVLLLHGFPSSSRMYKPLFLRLAGRYRLIAPDYPGFGHSDAPRQVRGNKLSVEGYGEPIMSFVSRVK